MPATHGVVKGQKAALLHFVHKPRTALQDTAMTCSKSCAQSNCCYDVPGTAPTAANVWLPSMMAASASTTPVIVRLDPVPAFVTSHSCHKPHSVLPTDMHLNSYSRCRATDLKRLDCLLYPSAAVFCCCCSLTG